MRSGCTAQLLVWPAGQPAVETLTAVAEHLQLVVLADEVRVADEAARAGAGGPLAGLGQAQVGAGRAAPHVRHLILGAEAGTRADVEQFLRAQLPRHPTARLI